jgi:Glycosyltransferase family 87
MSATAARSSHLHALPALPSWPFVLIAPAVLTAMTIAAPQECCRDFQAFYAGAHTGWTSGDWYPLFSGRPNMNWPATYSFLLPFMWLPQSMALAVWQVVQLSMLAALARRAVPREWPPLVCTFLGCTPTTLTHIVEGQFAWTLALVLWLAWQADREDRPAAAAAWLGGAIVLKPFVAFCGLGWLLRGRLLRISLTAAVVVGAVTMTASFVGWQTYRDWWWLTRHVTGFDTPVNFSLLGILTRHGGARAWPLLALVVGTISAWAIWRGRDLWAVGLPAAALVSPLAWQAYGWMFAPWLRSGRWAWLGLILWSVPASLGVEAGPIGLLVLWGAGVAGGIRLIEHPLDAVLQRTHEGLPRP